MSVIFNIILIIVCFFHSGWTIGDRKKSKSKKLNFPPLIEFKESDIGKPYYIFEGVDYELIPKWIYDRDHMTCYEEYTRCTRFLRYANPVCGYHTYQNRLQPFYSICELDLSSCKEMKRRKIHMYGTTYRQRGVYFMGEGDTCQIYVRRIAEGLVPRDIRDPPVPFNYSQAVPKPIITMTTKLDLVTTANDLQHHKTVPNILLKTVPNIEYDYDNGMY